MNHLHNTIRFNAEAAGLILSGRYEGALKILSSALQALKGPSNSSRRQSGGMELLVASSELLEQTSRLPSSLSSPSLRVSLPAPLSTPATPQISSGGYVFREPIVAVSDLMNDTPASAHRRVVAIVLYNLALAHHLQGLRFQERESTMSATYHLQTAQSMYQACLKVQIKHRFNLGDFYKLLVLPNNIGQVAMALGKTQSAKGYMAFLAKQLDQFLQRSNDNEFFPCREQEIEEFLHNTTRLTKNHPFSNSPAQVVPC